MLVRSASKANAIPAKLRRQANQQYGIRKTGRMYQLHSLWCRAQAQAATSESQSIATHPHIFILGGSE
jgi:hypothetical protein